MGIAEKVLIAAFSILQGGIVLALAIAFGWGGREIARDFLQKRKPVFTTRQPHFFKTSLEARNEDQGGS